MLTNTAVADMETETKKRNSSSVGDQIRSYFRHPGYERDTGASYRTCRFPYLCSASLSGWIYSGKRDSISDSLFVQSGI